MTTEDLPVLLGGQRIMPQELPTYRSMGDEELQGVTRVIESDCLSGFHGSPGPGFLGGPEVRRFEAEWSAYFGVAHTISVNSATSGLIAALGAVGIGPGDEVIVPPYTMSAPVVAPLLYGAIPVFVDIEPDHFCLDVAGVRAAITPRTKAIVAVNLFGHPAPIGALRALADEHGIALIEDSAQSPTASEDGRYCGTVGHIGVFSLNYHKHIHTGEGGMCVTDDDRLAERLRLIRNHGENLVEPHGVTDLTNLVCFNFRMTELSAAVGIEQLKKIDRHVNDRIDSAHRLTEAIDGLEGLTAPQVRPGCRHTYSGWVFKVDPDVLGITRDQFSAALTAEGVPHGVGYVEPLYLLPIFQQRIAIGSGGFPFTEGAPDYRRGLCPVVERMHEHEVMLFENCAYQMTDSLASDLARAIRRVHANRGALRA